jgi:hypothetical protein
MFAAAEDVALFYYVGHGQIDDEDSLCLGLVDSRTEAHRRATTSLHFSAVRSALKKSRAKTKIIILDCCFAGLATRPHSSLSMPADLIAITGCPGVYTIAASGEYNTAWFESAKESARPQTFFTKYLADLLQHGIPGEAEALTLSVIYAQLRGRLERDSKPLPTQRNSDLADHFVFAINNAPRMAPNIPAERARLDTTTHRRPARLSRWAPELTILAGDGFFWIGFILILPFAANIGNIGAGHDGQAYFWMLGGGILSLVAGSQLRKHGHVALHASRKNGLPPRNNDS